VRKPEGKSARGSRRRRGGGNIKTDLQEVGRGMDWIDLAKARDRWQAFVNMVMNLHVP
jgi:hypothetical protein